MPLGTPISFIRAAAVINSLLGTQTDQAPSVAAVLDALSGKLSTTGNGSGLTGLTVSQLSNASANAKSLLTAADYAAMRVLLGLVIGTDVLAPNGNGSSLTGLTQSQITNLVSDLAGKLSTTGNGSSLTGLTVSQLSDASANGRSLITAADYAAIRSLLGLVIGTNVLAPNGDASGLTNIPPSSNLPPLLPFSRMSTLMGTALNPGVTQPNVTLTANRLVMWLSQPMPTFTSLKLQVTVTTAAASGKVRVGVYNRASDCGAGTLVGEGELDASSTGNKSITISCTNTVTGIKWLSLNSNSGIVVRGHSKQSSLGRLDGGYAWYDTGYRSLTYGALPSDETSTASYTPLEADFPEIMWRGT